MVNIRVQYHEIRLSVYLRKSDRFVLKTYKWPNLRKQDSLTDGNYCTMRGCHMSKRFKIVTDLCSHYTTECENDYVKTSFLHLNFKSLLLLEKCKECFINYRLLQRDKVSILQFTVMKYKSSLIWNCNIVWGNRLLLRVLYTSAR